MVDFRFETYKLQCRSQTIPLKLEMQCFYYIKIVFCQWQATDVNNKFGNVKQPKLNTKHKLHLPFQATKFNVQLKLFPISF